MFARGIQGAILLLLLLTKVGTALNLASEVGCFSENPNTPLFKAVPGVFKTFEPNVDECFNYCEILGNTLAAMYQGNLCLCSSAVDTSGLTASSLCNETCPDLVSNCGGYRGAYSVYEKSAEYNVVASGLNVQPKEFLETNLTASNPEISVGSSITFNLQTSQLPEEIQYPALHFLSLGEKSGMLEFQDGGGETQYLGGGNVGISTFSFDIGFSAPGRYRVTGMVRGYNQLLPIETFDSVEVAVQPTSFGGALTCPPVWEYNVTSTCSLTVTSAFEVFINTSIEETDYTGAVRFFPREIVNIPDNIFDWSPLSNEASVSGTFPELTYDSGLLNYQYLWAIETFGRCESSPCDINYDIFSSTCDNGGTFFGSEIGCHDPTVNAFVTDPGSMLSNFSCSVAKEWCVREYSCLSSGDTCPVGGSSTAQTIASHTATLASVGYHRLVQIDNSIPLLLPPFTSIGATSAGNISPEEPFWFRMVSTGPNLVDLEYVCTRANSVQRINVSLLHATAPTNELTASFHCEEPITGMEMEAWAFRPNGRVAEDPTVKAVDQSPDQSHQNQPGVILHPEFNLPTYETTVPINFTAQFTTGAPVHLIWAFSDDAVGANISVISDVIDEIVPVGQPGPHDYVLPKAFADDGVYSVTLFASNQLSNSTDYPQYNISERTVQFIVQHPITPDWKFRADYATTNTVDGNQTGLYVIGEALPQYCFECDIGGECRDRFITNGTFIIDWGDGTSQNLETISNGTYSVCAEHAYTNAGIYDPILTASNVISNMTFPVLWAQDNSSIRAEVWEPITNLSLSICYFPTGVQTCISGYGEDFNKYPLDQNTTFHPKLFKGVVEKFEIRYSENDSVILQLIPENMYQPVPIEGKYMFGVVEEYNVSIWAWNRAQGWIGEGDRHLVDIEGKVQNITFNDFRQIVPPEETQPLELSFGAMGGATCLFVDFGDGTKMEWGNNLTCSERDLGVYQSFIIYNPMNLSHAFPGPPNLWNVTAIAWNPLSQTSAFIEILSVNFSCEAPSIWIDPHPIPVIRAQTLQFAAQLKMNCSEPYTLIKQWSAINMNDTSDEIIEMLTFPSLISKNTFLLATPEGTFPYGYNKLEFMVTVSGHPALEQFPIIRRATSYIMVSPSPLVAIAYKNSYTRILKSSDLNSDHMIYLQGETFSFDPDYPEIKQAPSVWIDPHPIPVIRAQTLQFAAQLKMNCSEPYTLIKQWRAINMNDTSDEIIEVLTFPSLSSKNTFLLATPEGTFPYGYNKLEFMVTVSGHPALEQFPIIRRATSYIMVSPSPLVAIAYKNAYTRILKSSDLNSDHMIYLQGETFSFDPDYPEIKQNWTYTWICHKIGETVDMNNLVDVALPVESPVEGPGCFGTGVGVIGRWGDYNLSASYFLAGEHRMTLVVTDYLDRKQTTHLEVEVIPGRTLSVDIQCATPSMCSRPNENGIMVNPTNALRLVGICIDCSDPNRATYKWEIKDGETEIFGPNKDFYPIGTVSKDLSLTVSFFKNLTMEYISLKLIVTYGNSIGYTMYRLTLSKPPDGGTCTLVSDPPGRPTTEIVALSYYHRMACQLWIDPDGMGIMSYTILPPSSLEEEQALRKQWTDELTLAEVSGNTEFLMMLSSTTQSIIETAKYRDLDYYAIVDSNDTAAMDKFLQQQTEVQQETTDALHVLAEEIGIVEGKTGVTTSTSILLSAVSTIEPDGLSSSKLSVATRDDIVTVVETGEMTPENVEGVVSDLMLVNEGVYNSAIGTTAHNDCNETPNCTVAKTNQLDQNTETAAKLWSMGWPEMDYEYEQPDDEATIACCFATVVAEVKAAEQTTRIYNSIEEIGAALASKLVTGETRTIDSGGGTSMYIEKNTQADFAGSALVIPGGTVDAKGGVSRPDVNVTFPNTLFDNLDYNGPVAFTSIVSPSAPFVGKNSNRKDMVSDQMAAFSMRMYNPETGEPIRIHNIHPPIKVAFPIPEKFQQETEAQSLSLRQKQCISDADLAASLNQRVVYRAFQPNRGSASMKIRISAQNPPAASQVGIIVGRGRNSYPSPVEGRTEFYRLKDLPWDSELEVWNLCVVKDNSNNTDAKPKLPDEELVKIAVFELIPGQNDLRGITFDNLKQKVMSNFSTQICIGTSTMNVAYWNDTYEKYSSDGLQLLDGCVRDQLIFTTTHMTLFTGGTFLKPNVIDFSYVFANAGFSDNLTIYMTIIFTMVVFTLIMIYAYLKDRQDVQKIGARPLPDNDPADKYVYEILVETGNQNSAMTDSKVSFTISGENDETGTRTFGKRSSKYPIFGKGQIDAFVMTTTRPLGPLSYLRMWHDNSGKGNRGSWFCRSVIVRDIITGSVYYFVVNNWFAVEHGDGMIDRLLPVAGPQDLADFQYLFSPVRVWAEALLVYTDRYGVVPESPTGGGVKFGPFMLTPEQIGVGVMANLIVFFPTFVIIFLFRTSRPRVLRKSRIDEALKIDPASQGGLKQVNLKFKKKKFTLPFFFTYIAWALVIACIAVSIFFVWAYEQVIVYSKYEYVFLITMLIVCVCKTDLSVDDTEEDEMDPHLAEDEVWVSTGRASSSTRRPNPGAPLDSEELRELRKKRQKEKEIWEILKEIAFYLLYLGIILVISYGNRDPYAFYIGNNYENAFIKLGDWDWEFLKVREANRWWYWLDGVVLSELRAQNWYNKSDPLNLRGYLDDRANVLIGYGIIRQIRVKPNSCRFSSSEELESYPLWGKLGVYSGGGYVFKYLGTNDEVVTTLRKLRKLQWVDDYTRALMFEFNTYNAQFFRTYWNLVDLMNLILSYLAIAFYILRYIETQRVLKIFKETFGRGYVRLQQAALLDESFGYVIGFLGFSSLVSFLKLLRFNRRIGILSATMKQCWDELFGFAFVFIIAFGSFAAMFYFYLHKWLYEWRSYTAAFGTSFSAMLGKFDFENLRRTHMLASVTFFFFAIAMSFIMINILLTIVIKSFEQVKEDLLKQPNDYEVLDFLMMRLKMFVGKNEEARRPRQIAPDPRKKSAMDAAKYKEIPKKVDRMLDYINNVYFDGKCDFTGKTKNDIYRRVKY
ncbi:unnamed protein product [Cyprideis torosa]|uniref:Uncharacterized protein n=1 Tax=Cyprideis torosa TaxID=163714 RepID=A0A7R8W434_9CRUS|nr:unnamed protein product [Cyprideis torosa]CAG0882734.1 unnamed protein product [Cyprideis torosa]